MNSIPFIFGISISQVITSGSYSRILSLASKGSIAVATTSISLSEEIPLAITSRNNRLSSTTRTLIFRFIIKKSPHKSVMNQFFS